MTSTLPGSYLPVPGTHDEMVGPDGAVRPAWRELAAALDRLGPDELRRRAGRADRRLVSEGAGHIVHQDRGLARSWHLDPVPLLVGAEEWASLEVGLRQRASLLEAVLDDLLGRRRLLAEGIVPAAAVLSWPGFRRATTSLPGGSPRITLYGPDLIRTADGRYEVLTDHTDVPVGPGLTLLHRTVSARLVPDLLRSTPAAPLTDLSVALRSALAARAPQGRANPRVLVHTTGPGRPEHLDHSLLATELGYHTVTGEDLAVRGGRLWLRSLGELEPVDVVLRRVPDHWVDPLEIPPGGPGGVPGLLQAVREGEVGVANAPGTGLAGHLALLPFLPDACRTLLGEDLLLGSPDTWWCGTPEHREEVLGTFDRLVLHDMGGPEGVRSAVAATLDDAGRAAWLELLERSPHRVVAQRHVTPSTTPVLRDGALTRGAVVIRAVVVGGPDGPAVVPGGLARVLEPDAAAPADLAKDVWVLPPSRGRVSSVGVLQIPQIDLRSSLPSRAGEALFWMGRNAERAETAIRLVQVVLRRVDEEPELLEEAGGRWLLRLLAGIRAVSGAIGSVPGDVPVEDLAGLLWGEVADALDGRAGGAGDAVTHLVAGGRSIREHLSTSTWRLLAMLEAELPGLEAAALASDPLALDDSLDRILVPLLAFSGLANESMVRGPGWRMLDIGKRIERCILLLGLLEATVVPPITAELRQPLHETVLTGYESLVAYRRRFRSDITMAGLAEMLVSDPENPRSIAFQLDQLADDIDGLPRGTARSTQRAMVAEAQDLLLGAPWAGGFGRGAGIAEGLHSLILQVRPALLDLTASVVEAWFAHAPDARPAAG